MRFASLKDAPVKGTNMDALIRFCVPYKLSRQFVEAVEVKLANSLVIFAVCQKCSRLMCKLVKIS